MDALCFQIVFAKTIYFHDIIYTIYSLILPFLIFINRIFEIFANIINFLVINNIEKH